MTGNARLRETVWRVAEGRERLSGRDCLELLEGCDLLELGRAARTACEKRHPDGIATFVIDRNINYTNVCVSGCRFCAFYREPGHREAYLLKDEEIHAKVSEAIRNGATQIMLQGGLHPELPLGYYEKLVAGIRARFPVEIHSFSPPEISHIAEVSRCSTREVLARLKDSGLDSLPGGGAEILVDRVRCEVSPNKIRSNRWLEVMREAHLLGMDSTATMMLGSVETLDERVVHLEHLRALQDETGGFRAFIAWIFQPGRTALGGRPTSIHDYLRTLAAARLYLDNFEHIQGSWVTMGPQVGQISLLFGADDLGSLMLEENVVRATGVSFRMEKAEMIQLIRGAGRTPAERDTRYRVLAVYPENKGGTRA